METQYIILDTKGKENTALPGPFKSKASAVSAMRGLMEY